MPGAKTLLFLCKVVDNTFVKLKRTLQSQYQNRRLHLVHTTYHNFQQLLIFLIIGHSLALLHGVQVLQDASDAAWGARQSRVDLRAAAARAARSHSAGGPAFQPNAKVTWVV